VNARVHHPCFASLRVQKARGTGRRVTDAILFYAGFPAPRDGDFVENRIPHFLMERLARIAVPAGCNLLRAFEARRPTFHPSVPTRGRS
jgi:hypothetical protein